MSKRNYLNYTDNDIIRYASEVKSMSKLLDKLGLRQTGGNYNNMKRKLQKLNIDCSHWTGSGWSKNQQLKDWSNYTTSVRIKSHLILLRGHMCEQCKLDTWLNSPISIELHHIDSDKTNNNINNLQLLCPNCHSQTKSWKRGN